MSLNFSVSGFEYAFVDLECESEFVGLNIEFEFVGCGAAGPGGKHKKGARAPGRPR